MSTVKTRLQRGLGMLRAQLDRRYGERRTWLVALWPIARRGTLAPSFGGGASLVLPSVVLAMKLPKIVLGLVALGLTAGWSVWYLSDPPPASRSEPVAPAAPPMSAGAGDAEETAPAPPAELVDRRPVADTVPTGAIVGRVLDDASGRPLVGAEVRLECRAPRADFPDLETSTDADGRFQLDVRLPSGARLFHHYSIAVAPEHAAWVMDWEFADGEKLAEGQLDLGDVRLVRGVEVGRAARTHQGRAATPRRRSLGRAATDASSRDPPRPGPRYRVQPGQYRLVVEVEGHGRAERVLELDGSRPQLETRIDVHRPGAVTGTVDVSAVPADVLAELRGCMVLLAPNREQSYAVRPDGTLLPLTPNTAMVTFGKQMTFRLERVSADTDLRLYIAGSKLFGEAWFSVPPGGETQVTVHAHVGGELVFCTPDALPDGEVQIDLQREDGGWWPATWGSVNTGADTTLSLRRDPGTHAWRVRFWPGDRDATPVERTGTAEVQRDGRTEVTWRAR